MVELDGLPITTLDDPEIYLHETLEKHPTIGRRDDLTVCHDGQGIDPQLVTMPLLFLGELTAPHLFRDGRQVEDFGLLEPDCGLHRVEYGLARTGPGILLPRQGAPFEHHEVPPRRLGRHRQARRRDTLDHAVHSFRVISRRTGYADDTQVCTHPLAQLLNGLAPLALRIPKMCQFVDDDGTDTRIPDSFSKCFVIETYRLVIGDIKISRTLKVSSTRRAMYYLHDGVGERLLDTTGPNAMDGGVRRDDENTTGQCAAPLKIVHSQNDAACLA